MARSSSTSRSSSSASDARACQPNGSPACSQRAECHGPAATTKRAGGIGGRRREPPPTVRVRERSRRWPGPSTPGRPGPVSAIGRLEVVLVEAGEDLLRDVHAEVGARRRSRRRPGRSSGASRRRRSRRAAGPRRPPRCVSTRPVSAIRRPSYAGSTDSPLTVTCRSSAFVQLEEGLARRRPEPHRRPAAEGTPARIGQVEVDVVRDVGEDRGPRAGFAEGQAHTPDTRTWCSIRVRASRPVSLVRLPRRGSGSQLRDRQGWLILRMCRPRSSCRGPETLNSQHH